MTCDGTHFLPCIPILNWPRNAPHVAFASTHSKIKPPTNPDRRHYLAFCNTNTITEIRFRFGWQKIHSAFYLVLQYPIPNGWFHDSVNQSGYCTGAGVGWVVGRGDVWREGPWCFCHKGCSKPRHLQGKGCTHESDRTTLGFSIFVLYVIWRNMATCKVLRTKFSIKHSYEEHFWEMSPCLWYKSSGCKNASY